MPPEDSQFVAIPTWLFNMIGIQMTNGGSDNERNAIGKLMEWSQDRWVADRKINELQAALSAKSEAVKPTKDKQP